MGITLPLKCAKCGKRFSVEHKRGTLRKHCDDCSVRVRASKRLAERLNDASIIRGKHYDSTTSDGGNE